MKLIKGRQGTNGYVPSLSHSFFLFSRSLFLSLSLPLFLSHTLALSKSLFISFFLSHMSKVSRSSSLALISKRDFSTNDRTVQRVRSLPWIIGRHEIVSLFTLIHTVPIKSIPSSLKRIVHLCTRPSSLLVWHWRNTPHEKRGRSRNREKRAKF